MWETVTFGAPLKSRRRRLFLDYSLVSIRLSPNERRGPVAEAHDRRKGNATLADHDGFPQHERRDMRDSRCVRGLC